MASEYAADTGDARRTRRAVQIGAAIVQRPEASFPKMFQDEADLEALYRLVGNDTVAWRDLLGAHVERTLERAKEVGDVIAVHDTTDVTFRTYWTDERRQDMSKFTSRSQGFLAHASLAVAASGAALPLGLLRVQPFVHASSLATSQDDETRAFWQHQGGLFANEHERWFAGVASTAEALAARDIRPVHVMDCETDSYGLLSWLTAQQHRFVIRSDGGRKLEPVGALREFGELQVQLGERFDLRDNKNNTLHPSRRGRTAHLTVRAGVVRLRRATNAKDTSWSPGGRDAQPKTLDLHLVEAFEPHPPDGEQPVRWLLLTAEPIDTAAQVLRIVDLYRRRWLIEEYFKALKTGCRLEARQMESASAMLRVMALLAPAAWRLLLLRSIAAEQPEAHWSRVLTPLEFGILCRAVPKAKLKQDATTLQCLFAVAKLGGHLPRNGLPGWQTLHSGWQELQNYAAGARLAGDVINA